MNGQVISLPIQNINFSTEDEQDDLKKVTLQICKAGTVPSHGLFIENDAIINAQESIKNKPILCAYEVDEEGNKTDFQGHEMAYKIIKNGSQYEVEIVYIEQPVGLINESCNFRMEEIDGELWCVADGYLYAKYCNDAVRILDESNGEKSVSMEIRVLDSEDNSEDSLTHIKEFKFLGVTMLGEAHPPAIQNANIQTFSQSDTFALQFSELIERVNKLETGKGGIKLEEDRQQIIDKYTSLKGNKQFEEIIANVEIDNKELESQLFSLSVNDLESKIREELSKQTYVETDWWGDTYECRKYWLRDTLTEENIVIVEDNQDYYKDYGIPYTLSGDAITLDFANAKRYIRGDWRLFEEGTIEPQMNPIFEEISKHNLEKVESIKVEFESTKENFEKVEKELTDTKANFTDLQSDKISLEEEVNALKEFKTNFEKEQIEKQVDAVVEKFTELKDIEGFEKIIEKKFELPLEELEKEFKALAYDNGIVMNKKKTPSTKTFSKNEGLVKTIVDSATNNENLSEAEKRYGSSIKKYLNN